MGYWKNWPISMGLISDLRFDYKKRKEAAMMESIIMQRARKIPQWMKVAGGQCCICLDSVEKGGKLYQVRKF